MLYTPDQKFSPTTVGLENAAAIVSSMLPMVSFVSPVNFVNPAPISSNLLFATSFILPKTLVEIASCFAIPAPSSAASLVAFLNPTSNGFNAAACLATASSAASPVSWWVILNCERTSSDIAALPVYCCKALTALSNSFTSKRSGPFAINAARSSLKLFITISS